MLVAGTAAEAGLVEEVVRAAGTPDVRALPATGLPVFTAWSRAAVALVNNSGGLHLADAVGTPVVVTYAGTERLGDVAPRAVPAALLQVPTPCSPCRQLACPFHLECLDVAPERLVAAALRLAAGPAAARRGAGRVVSRSAASPSGAAPHRTSPRPPALGGPMAARPDPVDRVTRRPRRSSPPVPAGLASRIADRAPRVLVLGDALLDGWLSGPARRLGRDGPVPVVGSSTATRACGGAANTAANLAALGATVDLLAVFGDDGESRILRGLLADAGVRTDACVIGSWAARRR